MNTNLKYKKDKAKTYLKLHSFQKQKKYFHRVYRIHNK